MSTLDNTASVPTSHTCVFKDGRDTGEGFIGDLQIVRATSAAVKMAGEDIKRIQKAGKRCTVDSCINDDGQIVVRVVDANFVRHRYTLKTFTR